MQLKEATTSRSTSQMNFKILFNISKKEPNIPLFPISITSKSKIQRFL